MESKLNDVIFFIERVHMLTNCRLSVYMYTLHTMFIRKHSLPVDDVNNGGMLSVWPIHFSQIYIEHIIFFVNGFFFRSCFLLWLEMQFFSNWLTQWAYLFNFKTAIFAFYRFKTVFLEKVRTFSLILRDRISLCTNNNTYLIAFKRHRHIQCLWAFRQMFARSPTTVQNANVKIS